MWGNSLEYFLSISASLLFDSFIRSNQRKLTFSLSLYLNRACCIKLILIDVLQVAGKKHLVPLVFIIIIIKHVAKRGRELKKAKLVSSLLSRL